MVVGGEGGRCSGGQGHGQSIKGIEVMGSSEGLWCKVNGLCWDGHWEEGVIVSFDDVGINLGWGLLVGCRPLCWRKVASEGVIKRSTARLDGRWGWGGRGSIEGTCNIFK